MGWLEAGLLLLAGLMAGAVNAIAGGGVLFTFPAFLAVGVPPVAASASSAVAVWPGHAAALPAYRDRLRNMRAGLPVRCGIALLGGLAGAALLLLTGDRLFSTLVPWLLLFSTLLFAFGHRLRALLPRQSTAGARSAAALAAEFAFAVYGGYFGGGLGVLLLAALSLMGHDDLHDANALKNLLGTVISSVAVATFIMAGVVAWGPTLVTLTGAIAGGFMGARLAQRVSATWLRRGVVGIGAVLTIRFFWSAYRA